MQNTAKMVFAHLFSLDRIRWWYSKFSSRRSAPSYEKKMAFLRIHFLHLSLTSQEKVKEIWNLKIRIFDFIGRCETLRGEFWIPSTYTMEQKLVQKYAKYCKKGFCTPIFARPYTLMVFKILLSTFRTFLWKKKWHFSEFIFCTFPWLVKKKSVW